MYRIAVIVLLACAVAARAQVPTPTVDGPITSPGSAFVASTSFDLGQVGYRQEEYFLSGTATAYTSAAPLTSDGAWSVTPGDTAGYKTRILVNRPIDPKKFNGTVVVEWLNVSGGLDSSPDWLLGHVELIRDGFVWVGLSAQKVGIDGGASLGIVDLPLKKANPARYASLVHPGDSFSYDMFSQTAQVARNPLGPLGDLKVKRVIAAGESQSAFRMVTYVNAIHPLTHVYDGFLVHSRGSGGTNLGAPLAQAPQAVIPVPDPTLIRADIDVPVLTLQTETDLTFLNFFPARQDDTKKLRTWEVAGTAHADTYTLLGGMTDLGTSPDIVELIVNAAPLPPFISCDAPLNSGPHHFVVNAAFSALNRWVRRGKAPKSAPRLDVAAGPPVAINTDANGNALGGIRTPAVDVPIATFGGLGSGSITCTLFGSTVPFDQAKLASLYPTHKAFVKAYNKALKRSVRAGWILKPDAKLMKAWAKGSSIGG
jgi:hypothetical protein